jgi:hypothetical protein
MAPTYVEFAVPLKREGAGSLFGVAYEPSTSPRGVLVVHHGYGEHSGRYQTGERPFTIRLTRSMILCARHRYLYSPLRPRSPGGEIHCKSTHNGPLPTV